MNNLLFMATNTLPRLRKAKVKYPKAVAITEYRIFLGEAMSLVSLCH